jgi:hypothetical protein
MVAKRRAIIIIKIIIGRLVIARAIVGTIIVGKNKRVWQDRKAFR